MKKIAADQKVKATDVKSSCDDMISISFIDF